MNHRLHRRGAILLLFTAVAYATPAAADPTPADRNVARSVTIHGRDKLKAGEAESARKLFLAAHALMGSPVTGLDVARANVALGLLVEARDAAIEVARIPVGPREPKVSEEARSAAAQLADDLSRRIPSLVINIAGPPEGVGVSIRVDGSELPANALSSRREANPGEHTVVASASGYVAERRRVTLKEGQVLAVPLKLSPVAPVGAGPCPAENKMSPKPPPSRATPAVLQRPADRRDALRPSVITREPFWKLHAVSIGAGAVSVLTAGAAVGFGAKTLLDYRDLASTCGNSAIGCSKEDRAAVQREATATNILWGAAGAAAVATAAIFTYESMSKSHRVSAVPSLAGAGLRAWF